MYKQTLIHCQWEFKLLKITVENCSAKANVIEDTHLHILAVLLGLLKFVVLSCGLKPAVRCLVLEAIRRGSGAGHTQPACAKHEATWWDLQSDLWLGLEVLAVN